MGPALSIFFGSQTERKEESVCLMRQCESTAERYSHTFVIKIHAYLCSHVQVMISLLLLDNSVFYVCMSMCLFLRALLLILSD